MFNVLFTQAHGEVPILNVSFVSSIYLLCSRHLPTYNVCIKCEHIIAYCRDHNVRHTRHKIGTFIAAYIMNNEQRK